MTLKRRMTRSRVSVSAAAAVVLTLTAAVVGPATAAPSSSASDPITHEQNDRVPKGAAWTQHYFPSSDGSDVQLHADVLLPEGLPPGQKVPVILSASPYFGHSGQLDLDGFKHTGPSARFSDFTEGAELFKRGYAYVMVDLRGFGGATGCLESAGAGHRADIKAAIDWAASQPWSTGKVGMYGKSYDAITGLIGNNLNQDALKAVVAQEPIWNYFRNIRSNGVPRTTMVNMANEYTKIATLPQMPDDDAHYRANADYEKTHPECALLNQVNYQTADPNSAYWKDRDYAAQAKGTDTPLFFTQGTLEWNTEPEAMQEFLTNHQGPERGWIGPWDHVRGNEHDEHDTLKMGRDGWFNEVMSFYDEYLKGVKPVVRYPNFAVQDNSGTWRAQETWPVADRTSTITLTGGSYVDNGGEAGPDAHSSFIRRSTPVRQATRITATPRMTLHATGHGNVMVKLLDVAPDGTAVMVNDQVAMLKPGETAFDLKSMDWTLAGGHSLAIEIGTIQGSLIDDWIKTPTNETINVLAARLDLALSNPANDKPTSGARALYLDAYLKMYTKPLPPGATVFPWNV